MSRYTKEDIFRIVEEEDVEFIRLQFTDLFGNLKNIAVTASQLDRVLSNKCMFDGSAIDGFARIEESDMYLYPDLSTLEIFPWRPQQGKVARMICDVYRPNGQPFEGDPRYVLKRAVKQAEEMGYTFEVGPECEFFNIPYGQYIVCELRPAEGYLPNAETYPVTVSKNDEVIEITVENDKIPKLKTTATIDGEKEVTAGETVTIDDVVSFRHLVPNKEYTLKGVLMDKKTGKPFVVDDEEITSEVTFTPETSNGEVTVSFTFDGSAVTKETDIVVFESLYSEDVEIATHTDIEDENQTVKIHPQPEPEKPQTGDNSNIGFWIGLGAVALGGLVSVVIIKIKKKDEDDE